MDPTGCPENTATDFVLRYDTLVTLSNNDSTDPLRCSIKNVAGVLGTVWVLTILRAFLSTKQWIDWMIREKQRKKKKQQRSGRLPIIPGLSLSQMLVQALMIGLFQNDLISTRNGASVLFACAWGFCCMGQVAVIFKKILGLGLRIIPLPTKTIITGAHPDLHQLDRVLKITIGVYIINQILNVVITILGATVFAGQFWTAQVFWISTFIQAFSLYSSIVYQYQRCINVISKNFPLTDSGSTTGTRLQLAQAISKMFLQQCIVAGCGVGLTIMFLLYGIGVVPFFVEMFIIHFGVDVVWTLLFAVSTFLARKARRSLWHGTVPTGQRSPTRTGQDEKQLSPSGPSDENAEAASKPLGSTS